MSQKRAGGSSKNLRDSKPKYLGVKQADGSTVKTGEIIVRQRGTKIMAGNNVGIGKDHTLYAKANGVLSFRKARKTNFTGKNVKRSLVEVKTAA